MLCWKYSTVCWTLNAKYESAGCLSYLKKNSFSQHHMLQLNVVFFNCLKWFNGILLAFEKQFLLLLTRKSFVAFFRWKKCLPPVKFNAHNLPPSLFTRFNTKSEYKIQWWKSSIISIFIKTIFMLKFQRNSKIMCHKWKFYQCNLYQSGIFHIFTFTYMIKWEYLEKLVWKNTHHGWKLLHTSYISYAYKQIPFIFMWTNFSSRHR